MSDQARPPNVLFLFPDQWRWDWLGCVDSPLGKVPVRTPNLDALAARGTLFTQCRTNSPLCAPARACLATGMRYHRSGVPNNGYDLDLDRPNIFKRLRDAGYRVAVTGKPDLRKHGTWKGLDGWTQNIGRLGFTQSRHQAGKWDAINTGAQQPQDFYMATLHAAGHADAHMQDYRRRKALIAPPGRTIDASPTPLPRALYTDDVTGRAAADFLAEWGPGEPWMLWVNFPGPHEPFDPPAELLRHYDGVAFPGPAAPGLDSPTPQDDQALRRAYAAMCEGIDEWVGRLLDAVDRRGETDRTVIVFASDHGEMLGDRGRWSKSVPYEGAVHVPLIVAGPGIAAGQRCDALVELIDIGASVLQWTGCPALADADALPLPLSPDAPRRAEQFSGLGVWRMLCDGRHKLITRDGAAAELYDLAADPAETRNLLDTQRDLAGRLLLRLSHIEPGAPVNPAASPPA